MRIAQGAMFVNNFLTFIINYFIFFVSSGLNCKAKFQFAKVSSRLENSCKNKFRE